MSDILLVFATPQEAKPFITLTNAEKINQKRQLIYHSSLESITLLVTGIGVFNASIRLTEYLSTHPTPSIIVNIGLAGSFGLKENEWYIASAFSYLDCKTHYSDIISRKFKYAHLHTVNKPADNSKMAQHPLWMYDMEAYGLATSARYFLENHQFHAFKFISDRDGNLSTVKNALSVYENSCYDIWSEVRHLFATTKTTVRDQKTHQLFIEKIENFSIKNKLSFSQKHLLIERLTYLKNLGLQDIVERFLQNSYISITDRDKRFNEILNDLNLYE